MSHRLKSRGCRCRASDGECHALKSGDGFVKAITPLPTQTDRQHIHWNHVVRSALMGGLKWPTKPTTMQLPPHNQPERHKRHKRFREPAWRASGDEPDYRFTLANERTFLASTH